MAIFSYKSKTTRRKAQPSRRAPPPRRVHLETWDAAEARAELQAPLRDYLPHARLHYLEEPPTFTRLRALP